MGGFFKKRLVFVFFVPFECVRLWRTCWIWKDKSSPHWYVSINRFRAVVLKAFERRRDSRLSRCFCSLWGSRLKLCSDARRALRSRPYSSLMCIYCSWKPLTFHPVHHLTGAPLAHWLHNQCHGRSLSRSRVTKEKTKKNNTPNKTPPLPPGEKNKINSIFE